MKRPFGVERYLANNAPVTDPKYRMDYYGETPELYEDAQDVKQYIEWLEGELEKLRKGAPK